MSGWFLETVVRNHQIEPKYINFWSSTKVHLSDWFQTKIVQNQNVSITPLYNFCYKASFQIVESSNEIDY